MADVVENVFDLLWCVETGWYVAPQNIFIFEKQGYG